MRKISILFTLLFSLCANAQNRFIDSFNVYNDAQEQKRFFSQAKLQNSYHFMTSRYIFAAYLNMWKITNDISYYNVLKAWCDTLINSARVTNTIEGNIYPYKDNYYGWISRSEGYLPDNEVPLYESYIVRYIFELLYYVKLRGNDPEWYNSRYQWFTDNLWTKWKTRSRLVYGRDYTMFLRSALDMGSHWAAAGLILSKIGSTDSIRKQGMIVYTSYDTLLKRNLKPHPLIPNAYTLNSSYDDVSGTDAVKSKDTIQDVSHLNLVLSYVTFANKLKNPAYPDSVLQKFANLAKGLYKNDRTFYDMVNITMDAGRKGNWGNSQADGFIPLAEYDTALFNIYKDIFLHSENAKKYGQKLLYAANLAMVQYYVTHPSSGINDSMSFP